LFDKLRDKGLFWSFSKRISFFDFKHSVFIEYVLKYGDFCDIVKIIDLYGQRYVKKVWNEKIISDKRFIKTNLLIARVFFGMDVEADYFKRLKMQDLRNLECLLPETKNLFLSKVSYRYT